MLEHRRTRAAKRLGVGLELIEGLVSGHVIEGEQTVGRTGEPVTLVYEDQLVALAKRMAAQR